MRICGRLGHSVGRFRGDMLEVVVDQLGKHFRRKTTYAKSSEELTGAF